MKEFWDKRYEEEGFAYGTEPNVFLREELNRLDLTQGKALFVAEGEGRNAVYAAERGFEVTAFDISSSGKEKALQLAKQKGVLLTYYVGDIFSLAPQPESFDLAVLIFAHFPSEVRKKIHTKTAESIKPRGYILVEGFSKNNLALRAENPQIGGPDSIHLLYNTDEIREDFPDFEILHLAEETVELNEGKYHKGTAKVIRFIGRKRH